MNKRGFLEAMVAGGLAISYFWAAEWEQALTDDWLIEYILLDMTQVILISMDVRGKDNKDLVIEFVCKDQVLEKDLIAVGCSLPFPPLKVILGPGKIIRAELRKVIIRNVSLSIYLKGLVASEVISLTLRYQEDWA